ncbi:MAG TPA: TA system VapC family ribonuclease toxin [Acidimicrobiales bacterium]|nr:TA system VapC family ribonuclease toxin [Acidimicrobiales bacterium]
MSQTLDTNVLLYASNVDAPEQPRASALLQHLAAGPDLVVLLWPAIMGYLRIATHPSIFSRPLAHADAVANVEALAARPHVRVVGESERFWEAYRNVSADTPVRGNGVTDAHLVALMVDHGISSIWSRDRDFRKYRGIAVRDPFEDRYSTGFALAPVPRKKHS